MKLIINGEVKEVSDEITVEDLIQTFHLPKEKLAVELNLQIIRRAEWNKIKLNDGDKLEIIHFVGGG